MTDLHKPLGHKNSKPSNGVWKKLSIAALTIGSLLALGFAYFNSDKPNTVVAELNNTPAGSQPVAVPKPAELRKPKPIDKVSTRKQPAEPVSKPEVDDAPEFQPQKANLNRQKAWLPVPELIKKSPFGPLPVTSTSGLRPLDAYSERPSGLGKTRIAIVLGGLGISQTGTKKAIEQLPAEITLAFSPVGNSLNRWMQLARKQGHEVILQLPLEPLGYPAVNPGKATLLKDAPLKKNIDNLRWSLGRLSNYPIVMSYLGAGFSGDADALRPILAELKDRGLGWLDDGSVQSSKSLDLAEELRLPHALGNIVIDSNRQASRVAGQLQGLELLSGRRGYAIGTGTAFPDTIKALTVWLKQAKKKGIQIVPLSNLIKDYGR